MSDTRLSERVRPDVEAAPWVIAEIKELEETLEKYREFVLGLMANNPVTLTDIFPRSSDE